MSTIINGTSSAITFPDTTVQNTAALTTGGTLASATITALNTNGITFPATQVPSADPNTLDDYEEGSYTPTLLGASGTVGGYAAQYGKYTKIGNTVTVWAYVQINSIGSLSGQISLGGFPFTIASVLYSKASLRINGITALGTNGNGMGGAFTGGGGTTMIVEYGNNTGVSGLTATNLTSGTDIMIQLTYPAA